MKKLLLFLLFTTGLINAQNISFADPDFKNVLLNLYANDSFATDLNDATIIIDGNGDGEIQLSEALQIGGLHIGNTTGIDMVSEVNSFSNLKKLYFTGTNVENLVLSGLTQLQEITVLNNLMLNSAQFTGLTSLTSLSLSYCQQLTILDLSNSDSLVSLYLYDTALTTLNLSGKSVLENLTCNISHLTNLDLTDCVLLQQLDCSNNNIISLNLTSPLLTNLAANNNQIALLDLNICPDLLSLEVDHNPLISLDISNQTQLTYFSISSINDLESFNAAGCSSIMSLNIFTNVHHVNVSNCLSLKEVQMDSRSYESLNFSGCLALETLRILNGGDVPWAENFSITLDCSGLTALKTLNSQDVDITAVNISGCSSLESFFVIGSYSEIDFSDAIALQTASVFSYSLKNIYAKNGSNEVFTYLQQVPALEFFCVDDSQLSTVNTALLTAGLTNVNVNSYCAFTPGGNYNTVSGSIKFDNANDGCDSLDTAQPNIKVSITGGTGSGTTFTNETELYKFYTNAGSFELTPSLENESYFNISPPSSIVTFADNNNNSISQNFCLTANGLVNDVEIILVPNVPARPGFDAKYDIIIKNKGNQTISGNYHLTFNDALMDFIESTTVPSSQAIGMLNWNYSNLLPFEHRSTLVTFSMNTPMDVPAVDNGDILNFSATIDPTIGDFLPTDNTFNFDQIVVGSFDPNDISCVQGDIVAPEQIGNYLHYVVNFENTGTYAAENVVVKVAVDPLKYDLSTLQLLNGSHNVFTIINGNTVEFIFENIQLSALSGTPSVGGHGNVIFKIKTLPTLSIGDQVSNLANIYFDYNFPIATNDATTTFAALNNIDFAKDRSIILYPNPAKDFVRITADSTIRLIEIFDIQGRIFQTIVGNTKDHLADLSSLKSGVYFFRVTTEQGKKVEKFIKE